MTENCNSAYIEITEQVFSVTRTLYPTINCHLDRVSMAKIVCNIFCKRPHIECYFLVSFIETIMPDWTSTLSHVNIVGHGYVVQLLIPTQCR